MTLTYTQLLTQYNNRKNAVNKSSKAYYNKTYKITNDLSDEEIQKRKEKKEKYNARRRELYKLKKNKWIFDIIDSDSD